MVFRDRVVNNPVYVPISIDAAFSADCPPDYQVPPAGVLLVGDALQRLDSVEAALALCRLQLAKIRAIPAKTP